MATEYTGDVVPIATAATEYKGEVVQPRPIPSTADVALNAANKAPAAVADSLLNTPNKVWNLLKAGYGAATTAAGRPDLAPELTPNPDFADRLFRYAGIVRDSAEPATPKQRVVDTMVQGGVSAALNPASSGQQWITNMFTGLTGGGAAGVTKEKTGSDALAITAGMLAPVATNKVGDIARQKIAEQVVQQKANAVRDKTLEDAQDAGYVVPPSAVNPSRTNKFFESVAGKAAVSQEAATRNQPVTNKLAAQELGLPPGTPITKKVLNDYREKVAEPYREVSNLSATAANALEKLKNARFNARDYERHYSISGDPKSKAEAKRYAQEAEMLETALEKLAIKSGKPDLVPRLRESRQQIAKAYDIEAGLNVGNADISAPTIGRALDSGAPMTGNLETIGRFQQAFPSYSREAANIPTPGVSKSAAIAAPILAAQGAQASNTATGLLAGGLPFLSGPARSLVLSPTYQRYMAKASYSPGMTASALSKMTPMTPEEVALNSLLISRAIAERKER